MRVVWRGIAGMLLFWFLVIVYLNSTLLQPGDVGEKTERQLRKALQELDALKVQNEHLYKLATEIKDLKLSSGKNHVATLRLLQDKLKTVTSELKRFENGNTNSNTVTTSDSVPGSEHEKVRRRVESGVTEFWYYVSAELRKLKAVLAQAQYVTTVESLLGNGADHKRAILADLQLLSDADGAGAWRAKEARQLGDTVQMRLRRLQNPARCDTAKKVRCNLNKGCGFGCQLHHVVYCFIVAYGTGRTLVLDSKGWRYSKDGWDKVFLPLSLTCTDRSGSSKRGWGAPNVIAEVQVIELPIVDSLNPRPDYMPLSVPEDLEPRLSRLHGNPIVWWIGQLLRYLMRPQPELQNYMEKAKKEMGFMNPCVGIHVRRTDKVGTEAAYHSIDEYMRYADDFFATYELTRKVDRRRVFLASDDPSVLPDARKRFPDYEFIGDVAIARTAGLGSRYSAASLRGIILDIHILSLCDYLVCTFSSQVCRVAYELMQTYHADAAARFHSLDDIYYFGGQNGHDQVVRYAHRAQKPGHIDLDVGDRVSVAGNHWDGFSKGTNRRTKKVGLYPSYKVQDRVESAKMPTYEIAETTNAHATNKTR